MQEILFSFRWKVFDIFFYVFVEVLWNISSIDYRIDSISMSNEWSLHFWIFDDYLTQDIDWALRYTEKKLEKIYGHKYIIFMCANITDLMISVFESGICIRSFHIICSLNLERVSSPEIRRIIITKWWS